MAGFCRQRGDEIVGRRVAAGVRDEVRVDRAAERVVADVVLEHREERRAFLVGDAVERVRDVVRARDRLPDAPRAREAVLVHHAIGRRDRGEIGVELGPDRAQRLGREEGREALVEPQVIPPAHRDEIAKPLMCSLVCEHGDHADALCQRRDLVVDEQLRVAKRDRAGILHRARLKIGHRDEVELGIWKRDSEVTLFFGEQGLLFAEREARVVAAAGERVGDDRQRRGARVAGR